MEINRRGWLARTGLFSLAAALGFDWPLTADASASDSPASDVRNSSAATSVPDASDAAPLWSAYEQYLRTAKYVDLTHRITPHIPVWHGFGASKFMPTVDPATGRAYTWEKDGFEATHYDLATDQLGTQLDPPAHWNPYFPAIDELPPTFAVRPLVVIPIQDKAAKDPGYQMGVSDIHEWERQHGTIPRGSCVFIRSDWSKEWPNPQLATRKQFPGVQLAALKFLHLERHILFHGHEALDTDTTPTLEGEAWLLRNGYTQGEGIAHLDQVPEKGALVTIGFPKLQGGTGGYARYIAICPPDWKYGVSVGEVPEAPMARREKPLHWDAKLGMRVR
ncbi:MAG: cyclase family protein [Candidatus Acidiferrales bacterium]